MRKLVKLVLPIVLSAWLAGCTLNDDVEVNVPNTVNINETFNIDLETSVDGFQALLYINKQSFPLFLEKKVTTIKASDLGVGKHLLILRLNYEGQSRFFVRYLTVQDNSNTTETVIDVLPKETTVDPEDPVLENFTYSYDIVNSYPHSTSSYTQGLEFIDGTLYESTGLYGESRLRTVDIATGTATKETSLSDSYFGEGITYFNNKLFWLTWRGDRGFVYDKDLNYTGTSFNYNQSTQGWGLTHDDTQMIKSDGSDRLWFLDGNANEKSSVLVTDKNGTSVDYLNELEYVDGHVFANEYLTNNIHVIDPATGKIKDTIDMTALENEVKRTQTLRNGDEVLNGIAYNPDTDTLFVTGKNWNTMFELKLTKNPL